MHLVYRNVNDAFQGLCKGFITGRFTRTDVPPQNISADGKVYEISMIELPHINTTKTRYGEVMVIEEPVTITYTNPLERVLFNRARDANPFFHLIEALWVLSGSDNIKMLEYFNSKVKDFSDDGITWYGAYGNRWYSDHVARRYNLPYEYDTQIIQAIDILKRDRNSRRVVLQQWMPRDLTRVLDIPDCKDVPCNTEVMFLPRGEILDMTVINRSNDMLWGALGSNYVTFSVLHEYVARASGFEVGRYNQITNNLHVYCTHIQAGPNLEQMSPTGKYLWSGKWIPENLINHSGTQLSSTNTLKLFRNEQERKMFNFDIALLCSNDSSTVRSPEKWNSFSSEFFICVVRPMLDAWHFFKNKDYKEAVVACAKIADQDWMIACSEWMQRRFLKHMKTNV